MQPRAFIFDDDDLVRRILTTMLRKWGWNVSAFVHPGHFSSHQKDLRRLVLDEHACTVILTDLKMPFISGMEFLRVLHATNCKCTAIAAISGLWRREDLDRVTAWGYDTFAKPVDFSQLHAWLEEARREHRAQQDSQFAAPPPAGTAPSVTAIQ